jgi:hypothetical protein
MTDRRIVTSRIDFLPYVIWQAWDDRFGADGSPIGSGPSEADAIADLEWQLDEMEQDA